MIYNIIVRDISDNVVSILSFDCITSFDESWSANVTTQTVEKGFNITDNVSIDPPTYDITAILSSYTLFDTDREIVWDGDGFDIKGKDKSFEFAHVEARDRLIEVFKTATVVSILESSANSNDVDIEGKNSDLRAGYSKEISPCVITSLSISHPDAGTGAFVVSMKIQKITIATLISEQLPESESFPLLKEYEKKVTNTSSNSTSGSTADANTNTPTYTPPTEEASPKKDSAPTGISWQDGYEQTQRQAQPLRDRLEAETRNNDYMDANNAICFLQKTSGSYKSICTNL